ncbi:RING-H2 finger protein ATL43 isoform X1 [Ziziphus jujuba]|uniref:RING-H2 finger protein ATL43 isoform X1 n=1 Tax=Ziziphus jujuba TaxID=326968 RepID=A0A6P6G6M3_ZIZJJ|nr:RING-H2 finger protein ATL43 isoform X1 [Ziziphus jujuba]
MARHFCSFFFFIFFLLRTSSAHNNTLVLRDTNGASSNGSVISIPSPSSSPPPPPTLPPPPPPNLVRTKFSPFRPSIAVIVGVLTTMFSVTLLLLLYAKHCKRSDLIAVGYGGHSLNSRVGGGGGVTPSSSYARKNSGIDRSVIESLPVFRFGSLMGQKDGLECAVCLTRFESSEVLRLLPKCKHAFHVECVDTWLDAHSTCPLCRYRVDPEDILLVEDSKILNQNQNHQLSPPEPPPPPLEEAEANGTVSDIESQRSAGGEWETANSGYRRVSGRHSSAGEGGTGFLQVLVQKPGGESGHCDTASFYRRSLDSWSMQKKKRKESVAMGCFDRPRKDGLLLTEEKTRNNSSEERRVEHRIIISPGCSGFHQRWSDVQPSDLLYLRSEMIISDSRRFSGGSSRASTVTRQQNNMLVALQRNKKGDLEEEEEGNGTGIGIDGNRWSGSGSGSGRTVINSRSVSEITGLSRFSNRRLSDSNDTQHCHHHHHQQLQQQRHARLLSRWLAFISHSRPPPTT